MQLLVLGLNHNSAPLEIREMLAVKADEYQNIYSKILDEKTVYEACILSTCNRVEYYFVVDRDSMDNDEIIDIVSRATGIDKMKFMSNTYFIEYTDAIKHIFSVASGLDSLVLGEPQILGQLKSAFKIAKDNNAAGSFINCIAEFTSKTAKKVRTYTGISDNPVSVSYAAVELAKKIFDDISTATVLIIGAGEMCVLAARHLVGSGVNNITVTNRTFDKAVSLAKEFNAIAIDFSSFTDELHKFDIIISSTGSDTAIVKEQDIKQAMSKRKHKPMFFIDIAVPRDIEQPSAGIENVYIYDMDDLKHVVENNKKAREKEAKKALEIIDQNMKAFEEWQLIQKVKPTIKTLKNNFEKVLDTELQNYIKKHKIKDKKEIDNLTYLLNLTANKILHKPFNNLKIHAKNKSKYTLEEAIQLIFFENAKDKNR